MLFVAIRNRLLRSFRLLREDPTTYENECRCCDQAIEKSLHGNNKTRRAGFAISVKRFYIHPNFRIKLARQPAGALNPQPVLIAKVAEVCGADPSAANSNVVVDNRGSPWSEEQIRESSGENARFRGRGLPTKATRSALRDAFDRTALERVIPVGARTPMPEHSAGAVRRGAL
jgi:hypothetical protein